MRVFYALYIIGVGFAVLTVVFPSWVLLGVMEGFYVAAIIYGWRNGRYRRSR